MMGTDLSLFRTWVMCSLADFYLWSPEMLGKLRWLKCIVIRRYSRRYAIRTHIAANAVCARTVKYAVVLVQGPMQ